MAKPADLVAQLAVGWLALLKAYDPQPAEHLEENEVECGVGSPSVP